jgi:hypothetical protein
MYHPKMSTRKMTQVIKRLQRAESQGAAKRPTPDATPVQPAV